jgi:hypothetical protein
MRELDTFLQLWDREGIAVWPRKAMGLSTQGQILVKSRSELEALIEESCGVDCFLQTHTELDRASGVIYIIFIDIDSPQNLRRADKIKERILTHLNKEYEIKPYVHFSGFKGYHILIPVKVATVPPPTYPDFLKFCQLKLSLNLCDHQILGDVIRLVRIPGTYNSKAICKGLEGYVRIIQEWDGRELDPTVLWETFKLRRISVKKRAIKPAGGAKRGGIRPIVKELIEKCRKGQTLSHRERLIILFEMIAAGYTDQEIHSLFRNQPDYNEKKTQYFIEHARKRGYKPFTVQKILEAVRGANVG